MDCAADARNVPYRSALVGMTGSRGRFLSRLYPLLGSRRVHPPFFRGWLG